MSINDVPHITYGDFIKRAVNDVNINFIAFVISPWHAISLDASLLYMKSKGVDLNGMVLISPHPKTGINVTEESFVGTNYKLFIEDIRENKQNGIEVFCNENKESFSQFMKRRIKHLELYKFVFLGGINWTHKEELYIIRPNYDGVYLGMNIHGYKHARFVISDEGIGSYTSSSTFHLVAPIGEKWRGIRRWMNFFREEILLRRWIYAFHNIIETTIFNKSKKSLVPRKEVLHYYTDVLKKHVAQSYSINNFDLSSAVIIAPSVYVEEKDRYYGEDVRVWKLICDTLYELGYELYMKPHPRDKCYATKAESWHCKVINQHGLSMEELCAISKPKCVIGAPSTALVTASLFFDIKSICMADVVSKNLVSQKVNEELIDYKNLFGNFVLFPSSIESLISMMPSK